MDKLCFNLSLVVACVLCGVWLFYLEEKYKTFHDEHSSFPIAKIIWFVASICWDYMFPMLVLCAIYVLKNEVKE